MLSTGDVIDLLSEESVNDFSYGSYAIYFAADENEHHHHNAQTIINLNVTKSNGIYTIDIQPHYHYDGSAEIYSLFIRTDFERANSNCKYRKRKKMNIKRQNFILDAANNFVVVFFFFLAYAVRTLIFLSYFNLNFNRVLRSSVSNITEKSLFAYLINEKRYRIVVFNTNQQLLIVAMLNVTRRMCKRQVN